MCSMIFNIDHSSLSRKKKTSETKGNPQLLFFQVFYRLRYWAPNIGGSGTSGASSPWDGSQIFLIHTISFCFCLWPIIIIIIIIIIISVLIIIHVLVTYYYGGP